MTDELILNMFKLFYANYTVKNCISLEKYVSGFLSYCYTEFASSPLSVYYTASESYDTVHKACIYFLASYFLVLKYAVHVVVWKIGISTHEHSLVE